MSIHQVVDPDAGVNILKSLRKIMSIDQVVDPDAGVNILKSLRKIMSSRWLILILGSTF